MRKKLLDEKSSQKKILGTADLDVICNKMDKVAICNYSTENNRKSI